MADEEIRYIWTALDAQIAATKQGTCTSKDQCTTKESTGEHSCYVSPYGIPPQFLSGKDWSCRDWKPGTEYQVAKSASDLETKVSKEAWKATRFKATASTREWSKISFPDSITDLGSLCKHLHEKDPVSYPASLYAGNALKTFYTDKKGKKRPLGENTLAMLFDYWGNSRYRYEVAKSALFSWSTYATDADKLPVKAGDHRLEWAIRAVERKVISACPAGKGPCLPKGIPRVDDYIEELERLTDRVSQLFKAMDAALKQRMTFLARLHAVKIIGDEVRSVSGSEIVKEVDGIIPVGRKLLLERVVEAQWGNEPRGVKEESYAPGDVRRTPEDYAAYRDKHKRHTADAVADLRATRERLQELLDGETYTESVRDYLVYWGTGDHPDDALKLQQIDLLNSAMAAAQRALTQCHSIAAADSDLDLEDLQKALESVPEHRTTVATDLKGKSPAELLVTLTGKLGAQGTGLVGNNAGPPSLYIALVEGFATRKHVLLAAAGRDEIRAWRAGAVRGIAPPFHEFAEDLFRLLPVSKGKFRDDLWQRLMFGTDEDRAKIMTRIEAESGNSGKKAAGNTQVSPGWKAFATVLSLVSLAMTCHEAAENPPDTTLTFFAFAGNLFGGAGTVILGTYETYLTVVGSVTEWSAHLTKLNCVCGFITAVIAFSSGLAATVEAVGKGKVVEAIGAGIGTVGSAVMAYVCVATFFGAPPAWPVVAFALFCVLVSGAMSPGDILEELAKRDTNGICEAIVRSVHGDFLWWSAVENYDDGVREAMKRLAALCKTGDLPYIDRADTGARDRLLKAGLSDAIIERITRAAGQDIENYPVPD